MHFKISAEKYTITGPGLVLSKLEVREEFKGFPVVTTWMNGN